jgi:hypothetical protein
MRRANAEPGLSGHAAMISFRALAAFFHVVYTWPTTLELSKATGSILYNPWLSLKLPA